MAALKIFVVDDERILRISLADELRDAKYSVNEFANAQGALVALQETDVDVIITDVKMPNMDGIQFLEKVKKYKPDTTVVVMTAHASYPLAVKAIKKGAYDFITKPFEIENVLLMLERIRQFRYVQKDNKILRSQILEKFEFSTYIGHSIEAKKVIDNIQLIANSKSTVLIEGETGTGKELVTNIIHFNSNRKNKPIIKVSCAILSREIFESELFGHIKGAYTGAEKDKPGRFELADGGTLYLDDIDDIPIDLQVKLLRAIEEEEIERVGSNETIKIDVRIIASTKKDLKKLVTEGKFREDLYYRLNVFPIHLSPLRKKPDDIPYLFEFFIKKFTNGRKISLTKAAIEIIKNYSWPGNVRELRNIAERMAIIATGDTLSEKMLPSEFTQMNTKLDYNSLGKKSLTELLTEFEINAIKFALQKFAYNKSKAAKFLGLPISTLQTKMIKYNLN